MNEIITKLNEIEEKAEAIISDAKSRKERMMAGMEADERAIDEKYDRMEEEAAQKLRQRLKEEGDAQIQSMREQNEAAIERLDKRFMEQKEKLAEEIFSRIIS